MHKLCNSCALEEGREFPSLQNTCLEKLFEAFGTSLRNEDSFNWPTKDQETIASKNSYGN